MTPGSNSAERLTQPNGGIQLMQVNPTTVVPLQMISSMLEGADPVLAAATAIALAVFVLWTLLVMRRSRLQINLDALVFGEPGFLAAGVMLILAAGEFGGLSGVALVAGLVLVALALVASFTDIINL